ncbi:hypothetical protein [Flaviaesturariibacter amylovorans]|uniref:DUF3267 domain-containing protein n=1 Tax=Flaviaesturariibacter amylovorans TaxID=1084520 RepID=A0ABP8H2Y4_9BACT
MPLPLIRKADFTRIYWATLLPGLVMLAVAWWAAQQGIGRRVDFIAVSSTPLFIGTLALVFGHGAYHRRQLQQLTQVGDHEEKVARYRRLYSFRLAVPLLICGVCCVLLVLSGRKTFLYYGIFNLVACLFYFPSILWIRRELQDEELEFY